MTDEEFVADRADEWDRGGRVASAADLCRARPELARALQKRLDALAAVGWVDRLAGGRDAGLAPGEEPLRGYRLVSLLGRGGYGQVWKAAGPDGGGFALKFLPRDGNAARAELRGVNALRRLRHPNLLAVFGVQEAGDWLVVVSELADGTLYDRLLAGRRGSGGLPKAEALRYLGEAAAGLDFLHGRKVVHRDVKPQNLLLAGGVLKVADFGLARLVDRTETTHTGGATFHFTAPEVFGGRVRRESDQYALAVSYCQVRGGRLPFEGSAAEVMLGHREREPDLGMLPARERPAVARALAKDPSDRWPGCREFADAVAAGWRAERKPAIRADSARYGREFWARRVRLPAKAGRLRRVAFGGLHDQTPVALAACDGGAYVLNTDTGELVARLGVRDPTCVAVAPGGGRGAVGDGSGGVLVFDLGSGREVHAARLPPPEPPPADVLGPGIRELLLRVPRTDRITGLAWGPGAAGPWVGAEAGGVYSWDAAIGRGLEVLYKRAGGITALSVSDTRGVCCGRDGTVLTWDPRSRTPGRAFETRTDSLGAAVVLGTGRHVAVGGEDGLVRVFDLGGFPPLVWGQTGNPILAMLAWGKSGLLLSQRSGPVRLVDVLSSRTEVSLPECPGGAAVDLCTVAGRETGSPWLGVGTARALYICEVPQLLPAEEGSPGVSGPESAEM